MIRKNILFCVIFLSLMLNQLFSMESQNHIELNKPAPIFVLRDLNGQDVFLRDYCGNLRQPWKNKIKHVVVLSFFASYCKPCLKEIPILEKLATKFADTDLITFLINYGESEDEVKRYLQEKGFSLPVLLDRYAVVAKKYGVTSVPRIFVINQDGDLIWMTTGYDSDLAKKLEKMLEQQLKKRE